MGTRLELDALLRGVFGITEPISNVLTDPKVYYQPPANVQMKYPCIVYAQNDEDVHHADNQAYRRVKRWEITIIDRDPDSQIPDVIAALPMSKFNRRFVDSNLYHTVYNLFF